MDYTAYNAYQRFKKACNENKESVFPSHDALRDADYHFKLRTKEQLLEFVAGGGVEDCMTYEKTCPWKNNPRPIENPIDVYSFSFTSLCKNGYIAFFWNPKTNKWMIKSFHLSNTNPTLLQLSYNQALLEESEKNND